ncbi:MAG: CBS domain-containing protein [Anaerolineae bacterium]|nr:CBS domain-containing protein [Anaerolineae bacterium]
MSSIRYILQAKGHSYIWSVKPDDSVFEALRIMADKDVGALMVMDGEKLVGIISERDYARKVILFGKTSKDTAVKEIMSKQVIRIHAGQTTEEAMDLMNKNHIRHLPVMDEDDTLVGVISISDVLRDIIYRQREEIKHFSESIIK